ncbi:unnamed protein product, partial [Mesorhabditis belari]|uniref:Uncharacterized protein n=1 Tax=Mesorhabditis belari TaxID=2138241 RepID=A0AAF3ECX9_9BILA
MKFFFFFLLAALGTQAEPITLTSVDGSYLIHGMRLRRAQDLVVTADCTDCTIYVQLWANDSRLTDFVVKDAAGLSVSSKELTGRYFGPNVTVDLDKNTNYLFALSFTRSTEKSKTADRNFPHTILVLEDNGSFNSAVKATNTQQAYSYISPNTQATFTATVNDLSTNCTIDFFISGIPGDAGRQKYLLYDFNSTTLPTYRKSVVRTPAATFIIPPNCQATLVVTTELDNTDKLVPTASGFMMSPEYPGNFAASVLDTHPSLSMNASWSDEAIVVFEVISSDPGTSGSLVLFAGNIEQNFTKPITKVEDVGGLGKQLKVMWTPDKDTKSGFLLRYVVVKDEKPPKDKGAANILPFISSFFVLFFTLARVM